MNILITNFALYDQAGTEIFTLKLAKSLKELDHQVIVYSSNVSRFFKDKFRNLKIPIINNLEQARCFPLDVAHVHHNVNALKIRYHFPKLPIIFLCHGITPFLEQPPILDIKISQYLAISEGVRDHLIKLGIKSNQIQIFRNIFNENLFSSYNNINAKPQQALVISNRITEKEIQIINDSTKKLGISIDYIGKRFKHIKNCDLPNHINKSDLVFTLGRGAVETMMCGRIPIIYDHNGGDGMVTPDNFRLLMRKSFSGRTHQHRFTTISLIKEIKKYKSQNGQLLRQLALKYFDKTNSLKRLCKLYQQVKSSKANFVLDPKTKEQLDYFVKALKETRSASYHYHPILESKFYNLWNKYNQIKNKFFRQND
jgi:O-antigen biosynthesis protein